MDLQTPITHELLAKLPGFTPCECHIEDKVYKRGYTTSLIGNVFPICVVNLAEQEPGADPDATAFFAFNLVHSRTISTFGELMEFLQTLVQRIRKIGVSLQRSGKAYNCWCGSTSPRSRCMSVLRDVHLPYAGGTVKPSYYA